MVCGENFRIYEMFTLSVAMVECWYIVAEKMFVVNSYRYVNSMLTYGMKCLWNGLINKFVNSKF